MIDGFAQFKKYQMPHGITLRLRWQGTGYGLLILQEDNPKLFDLLCEDIELLKTLPVIFDTPEKYYKVNYISKDLSIIKGFTRNHISASQITFTDEVDTLTAIEMYYDWERILNEKEEQTEGQKALQAYRTQETKSQDNN